MLHWGFEGYKLELTVHVHELGLESASRTSGNIVATVAAPQFSPTF